MNDQIKYIIFILCPFIFYLLLAPIIIKLFVYYEICPLMNLYFNLPDHMRTYAFSRFSGYT